MKRVIVMAVLLSLLLMLFSCVKSVSKETGSDVAGQFGQSNLSDETRSITVLVPPWNGGPLAILYERFNTAAQVFYEKYGIEVRLYEDMWEDAFSIFGDLELQESYQNRIYAAIMAGQGPDLIFTRTNLQPLNDIYKKMDTGAFLDINEFITNDENFDIDEYVKVVLDAGIYKGKRYVYPTAYEVGTWMTTKEKFTELGLTKDDFSTYERYISTWEMLQKDGKVRFDADGMYCGAPLLHYGWLDECIDYETGTVDFNTDSFKRVMNLFRNERLLELKDTGVIGNKDDVTNTPIDNEIHQDKLFRYVGSVSTYATNYIDDYLLCPIPNAKGNLTASITEYCVIPVTAQNPDLSWEFIKVLTSDEVINESMLRISGVPIKNSQLDVIFDFWMKRWDEVTDTVYIDEVKQLFRSCDNAVISDTKGYTLYRVPIISEYIDSPDPNSGEKEFDEVKSVVENYFKIYLNE